MSEQKVYVSLQTFEENVKSRVKEIMISLIPEDIFSHIVETSTKKFLSDDLPNMVREELIKIFKEKISNELCKPEWQGSYDNTGCLRPSELISTIIKTNAPEIVAAFVGDVVQSVASYLRNKNY